ncbi:MAG: thioredoxin [Clostridia bacterium]|nr:thioredoxin [Clostridia bacterium]MBQ8165097.1 thioredoxin [Clostridia bacterium]
MSASNIYYINDANFDKVTMQSKMPVLIDFYADWCGPCRTLASVIEKVAAEYDGQVAFCKMNVDENPNTPNRYKIAAIPTVILFIDGLAAEKTVGLHDIDFYKEMLDKHLKKEDKVFDAADQTDEQKELHEPEETVD